ncbi:MAG: dephospho-CoA kinase [Myxococcota bacterium]
MASATTAIIGLTGGIACGKSTVAARFKARGAPVIDADVLARAVVEPGEPAFQALVAAFGPGIVQADGTLDRAAVGALAFSDEGARRRLNAITHPAIAARTGQAFAAAQRAGLPWVVYEAALIVENKIYPGLAGTIVVLCPAATQLERLMRRSRLDEAEARRRIAAQTNDEARRAAATWIIDNDGDLATLEARADLVFDAIVARHGPPRLEAS